MATQRQRLPAFLNPASYVSTSTGAVEVRVPRVILDRIMLSVAMLVPALVWFVQRVNDPSLPNDWWRPILYVTIPATGLGASLWSTWASERVRYLLYAIGFLITADVGRRALTEHLPYIHTLSLLAMAAVTMMYIAEPIVLRIFGIMTLALIGLSATVSDPQVPPGVYIATGGFMILVLGLVQEGRMALNRRVNTLEAQQRSLMAASFDGVIIHREGTVLHANPAAVGLLGGAAEDPLIGRQVDLLLRDAGGEWLSLSRSEDAEVMRARLTQDDDVTELEVVTKVQEIDEHEVNVTVLRDLADRLRLEAAEAEIQTLTGLLPVCANCHNVRDEDGNWQGVHDFLKEATESELSHGICDTCAVDLYGEFAADLTT